MTIVQFRYKGSSKSGNYGHAGRPGKVGGSAPRGSGLYVSEYGFNIAKIQGNDNINHKTFAEMERLYAPIYEQNQNLSRMRNIPIGSPDIEPGMRVAYDTLTNSWAISPDAYIHDAVRGEAGPKDVDMPYEFTQVTGFYDAKSNKLYFYDYRDSSAVDWLTEATGLNARAVSRKIGAAVYAAKMNTFKVNGERPSISYFNEVSGIYDKEWNVKFRYKGSSRSGNWMHFGRPGKVGGSAPNKAKDFSTSDVITYASISNANDWLDKASPKYSTEEKNALSSYTNYGFRNVNDNLRRDNTLTNADFIKKLDGAIHKGSVPEDVAVYRGLALKTVDLSPGTIFSDKAYVSTSLLKSTSKSFLERSRDEDIPTGQSRVLMRITVPKGSKAAFIHEQEEEVLLPRGSRFKITGSRQINITTSGKGTMSVQEIEAELLS